MLNISIGLISIPIFIATIKLVEWIWDKLEENYENKIKRDKDLKEWIKSKLE